MARNGRVLSINVGQGREFVFNGRPAKSAIWKVPVAGRIAARGVNLEGDDQADREAHGGPDKALYAYAVEDLRWWEERLGRSLPYGQFGENVTTEGIEVNDALVGERWEIGSTVLEVSEPRVALLAAWSSDGGSEISAPLYRCTTTRGLPANHRRGQCGRRR